MDAARLHFDFSCLGVLAQRAARHWRSPGLTTYVGFSGLGLACLRDHAKPSALCLSFQVGVLKTTCYWVAAHICTLKSSNAYRKQPSNPVAKSLKPRKCPLVKLGQLEPKPQVSPRASQRERGGPEVSGADGPRSCGRGAPCLPGTGARGRSRAESRERI